MLFPLFLCRYAPIILCMNTTNDICDEVRVCKADIDETAEAACKEDMADAETARKFFGIAYLYPWQRMVIANILDAAEEGERGNQIVLLPTGAGKSLCFMIPALLLNGPTLIIYPLLALMNDQKRRLDEAKLDTVVFRGGQSEDERKECFERIAKGARFILANPEVLQNQSLLKHLTLCRIAHIAIDEAHCVCEWGDSFRPAYLELGKIIKELGCKTVTAFTATASDTVLNRVAEVLFAHDVHIVRGETDRPNIHYSVHRCASKIPALIECIMREKRPAIVFCASRSRTKELALILRDFLYRKGERDTVRFYHAGLTREEKAETEQWFYPKKDAILVSTCAFGMGVDKKDIRTVIHYDAPSTAEAYVQEAGRGGRDGESARAVLLWSRQDKERSDKQSSEKGERYAVLSDFAEALTCRREVLLKALGEENCVCSGCDICEKMAQHTAEDAESFMRFLHKNRKRYRLKESLSVFSFYKNRMCAKTFGVHIYDEQSVSDMLYELVKSGRVDKKKVFIRAGG